MRRPAPFTLAITAALLATACAVNMGAPKEIPLATVAMRTDGTTDAAAAATALRQGGTATALLLSPRDDAWFVAVAQAANMQLSGPGRTDDGLGMAFLGREPLGDTAIDLSYDGTTYTVQDALYDLDERRFLDLLAFEVEDGTAARPLIRSLLEYVATDVDPTAAVVMAVAVPSAAVGDSVARMLSPGFEDALRCGGDGGDPGARSAASRGGVRLFYGPEARIFCRTATAEATALGEWVRASLVMGRR